MAAKPEKKPKPAPAPAEAPKPGPLATRLFEELGRVNKRLAAIESRLPELRSKRRRSSAEDEERSIFDPAPRDEEE